MLSFSRPVCADLQGNGGEKTYAGKIYGTPGIYCLGCACSAAFAVRVVFGVIWMGAWHMNGKTGTGLFATAFFALALFIFLGQGMRMYGAMEDGAGQMESEKERIRGDKPVIQADHIRVRQGEKKTVSSLVHAWDIDGKSLDAMIQYSDASFDSLDTLKPGKYAVTFSVYSRITGKKAQKTIIILIDGRVSKWRE